jgi:hypothetical protein
MNEQKNFTAGINMFTEKQLLLEKKAWKLQIRDLRKSRDNRGELKDILPQEMISCTKQENPDGSWSISFQGHALLGE